jgi:hypothetical protein
MGDLIFMGDDTQERLIIAATALLRAKLRSLVPEDRERVLHRKNWLLFGLLQLIQNISNEYSDIDSYESEDWKNFHGVSFTQHQQKLLEIFTWNNDTLNLPCPFYGGSGKRIRETHESIVTIEGLSIMELQRYYPKGGKAHFLRYGEETDYIHEKFANRPLSLGRYLVLKGEVPHSTFISPDDQLKLIESQYPDYEVPPPAVIAAMSLLMFQKTGRCHLLNRSVHTSDLNSRGERVHVGSMGHGGLSIGYSLDSAVQPYVGIAAMRKPDFANFLLKDWEVELGI